MGPTRGFGTWLTATMQHRGLTQADLARSVGVADAQVSRWRRGQVVPSVHYLQRIADAFGVSRVTLDSLVGYPVEPRTEGSAGLAPADQAEMEQLQAWFGRLLRERVPRSAWRSYAEACEALAESLDASLKAALGQSPTGTERRDREPQRDMGFHP